ncbi:hypothetical protein YTPLAS18_01550 [Nitrospira sp.]|nr:hypothetical protein YTPLAS18_01550 [Nitrospira sp.]
MAWVSALILGVGCYGSPESGAPDDIVPQLVTLLTDPNPDVRRTAAVALGRIGATQAVDALLSALRDSDPAVRQWAAWAVGVVASERPRDVGPPLIRLLADPSAMVRKAAAQALGELDEDSTVKEQVFKQFQSGEGNVRSAAALALVGHGRIEWLADVRRAFPRLSATGRQALVAMLGELGDSRVIPMLEERLQTDENAGVRGEAAYRLGIVGGRDALPVLHRAATDDPNANVRRWAEQAAFAVDSAVVPD